MKPLSNDLKLIFSLIVMGFLTGLYLFSVEAINQNPQHNKQWTAVYFLNPTENSLNFAIENYEGRGTVYEYSLAEINGNIITTKDISLLPGQKKEVKFEAGQPGKKIIIRYNEEEVILTRP